MSHPKTLQRYTSEWFTLFDQFKADPDGTVELDCETPKKAAAVRLEFYKAREAFLKDPDMAQEYGEVLNSREVKVRDTHVIFDHKERNWVGNIIRRNLAPETQTP